MAQEQCEPGWRRAFSDRRPKGRPKSISKGGSLEQQLKRENVLTTRAGCVCCRCRCYFALIIPHLQPRCVPYASTNSQRDPYYIQHMLGLVRGRPICNLPQRKAEGFVRRFRALKQLQPVGLQVNSFEHL